MVMITQWLLTMLLAGMYRSVNRYENNVEPGKILLLTSSPGRLMKRLSER